MVFNKAKGFADLPLTVACGQCIGCRLSRSKQWAVRCYHEASLHELNCFITLTYSDEHMPVDHSVDVATFQKFMKRLRKKYGQGIRYFHCGEYGSTTHRPHYHALLFNFDFPDKELFQEKSGYQLYISKDLGKLWPFGFSTIGALTFESAAYCARYVMKKVTGKPAEDYYKYTDPVTGELLDRHPEYVTMSLKPGIGYTWYRQYKSDLWPDDFVVVNGKKMKIPRYYDNILEKDNICEHEIMKGNRVKEAKKRAEDNTAERLEVRRKVCEARVNLLKRDLE